MSVGRPKSQAKHHAILGAAQALFVENGFEQTTVEAVAKAADVSKLTIYSHFDDKESLFKAAIRLKCEAYHQSLNYVSQADLPRHEVLLTIGLEFLNGILNKEAIAMYRIIEAESYRHPRVAELFYEVGHKRTQNAVADLLRQWVKNQVLFIPDVDKAAGHFLSLVKGDHHMTVMLNVTKKPDQIHLIDHVKSCVDFFMEVYGKVPSEP